MTNDNVVETTVQLGRWAPWIGPAIFAFATVNYVLAVVFEDSFLEWNRQFVTDHQGPAIDLGHVVLQWRAMVLLMIGAGSGAFFTACWAIYIGVWADGRRWYAIGALLALTGVVGLVYLIFGLNESVFAGLASQTLDGLPDRVKVAAEFVALVVGIGGAALLVLPTHLDAGVLVRRVRALRLLLYSAAALFTVTTLAIHTAFSWLLPDAGSIALAGTLVSGAMYTLMLATVFVPAGIVLDWAARQLARTSEGEKPAEQDDWLERHGLSVSWQSQLTKAFALFAPLASSGLGQVLSSLAGAT